jgi:hypothetical protein
MVIGALFYFRTLNNEYALDDNIEIHLNQHVIKGVKGIKDIVTKGDLDGVYRGCGNW